MPGIEFRLPGDKPAIFRVVSLALHVWTCLFGWFVLRRLSMPAAWLVAALWAVHPSALPTVAWPSRQGDLLAAAAAVTAIWAYLLARGIRPAVGEHVWTDPAYHEPEDHAPRWPWVLIGSAAGVALLCGSATAVFAVAGVAAVEVGMQSLASRRGVILAGLLTLAVAARVILPHGPLPSGDARGPVASAFAEAAAAGPWATVHAAVPFAVPFLYDRWQWGGNAAFAFTAVTTVGLIVVPLLLRRRHGWTTALSAAAAFAFVHGLTAHHDASAVAAADVLPYAAGTAVIAIAIFAIHGLVRRPALRAAERPVRWFGGGGALLLAATITFDRGPSFADAEAAWRQTLDINPESAVARQELAANFVEHGFLDEAGTQLDRVAELHRGLGWLLARGRVFDAQKRYDDAAACYETAHARRPDDVSTTMTLAEAYANANRLPDAAGLYNALLATVTTDANLYTNAGLTQMRLGHAQTAVDLYRGALSVDPRHIPAHVNLANALFEMKQFREAAEHLQQIIALDPRNYVAFVNAGVMLYRLGDPAKAERMFRAAVHLNPRSADAYRKLAATLTAQKKDAEAAWCLGQARRSESDGLR